MSEVYENKWPCIYKKPVVYTDDCNDNITTYKSIPTIPCASICLTLTEEINGQTAYIRGCYDSILQNRFNSTITKWYRWMHRDFCRNYRKNELFNLQEGLEFERNSTVGVCTYYPNPPSVITKFNPQSIKKSTPCPCMNSANPVFLPFFYSDTSKNSEQLSSLEHILKIALNALNSRFPGSKEA
ncbi:hypothetical protein GCK72_015937 [Caenorhabditis remanei]|uniref:Uncharacterized protein n=1 Tax=Caenorhabditis remanei TaxID=31234 RepID=A0A6A5GVE7_CAERE|nr:hypothetical protein GCK72_015937 [Caenorhabditis remanei]KAF1759470.1 hypothetical protein GCK72_015937 [Caenorhabditis remanei]